MGKRLVVIGSLNMDLVVRAPRAPVDGESLVGTDFARYPGGKGANQAVAAARLGCEVFMAGMVGADSFGDELVKVVAENGVDTTHIKRNPQVSTGVALITVEDSGNNRAVVVPGANRTFGTADLRAMEDVIASADMVLMQLEMDLEMIGEALDLAEEKGVPVILNPAPYHDLHESVLKKATYLTPNETEAEGFSGLEITDLDTAFQAAEYLHRRGMQNVFVTLGGAGVIWVGAEGRLHVPAYEVKAVDTVAAGDCFNAALACALMEGKSIEEALHFANAAAALSVSRKGAIPSLPTRAEVDRFLSSPK